MTYLEFKQAAKKHYKTSKCLYERCDNNDWQIQENIVYLCGYVIEMMIKYQIYRRINHPIYKDIRQIDKSRVKVKFWVAKNLSKLRYYRMKKGIFYKWLVKKMPLL